MARATYDSTLDEKVAEIGTIDLGRKVVVAVDVWQYGENEPRIRMTKRGLNDVKPFETQKIGRLTAEQTQELAQLLMLAVAFTRKLENEGPEQAAALLKALVVGGGR